MRIRFLRAFAYSIGSLIAFRSTLPLIFRTTAPGGPPHLATGVLLPLLLYAAVGLSGLMLRELLYGVAEWIKHRQEVVPGKPAR